MINGATAWLGYQNSLFQRYLLAVKHTANFPVPGSVWGNVQSTQKQLASRAIMQHAANAQSRCLPDRLTNQHSREAAPIAGTKAIVRLPHNTTCIISGLVSTVRPSAIKLRNKKKAKQLPAMHTRNRSGDPKIKANQGCLPYQ